MRDIECPNCHKDEFMIVEVNGIKVKKCRQCGGIYQLAEPEVNSPYRPDSKDADGNFIKCPICGCEDFKKTEDFDPYADMIWSDRFPCVPRHLNHLPPGYYICLNRKCRFVWKPPLF